MRTKLDELRGLLTEARNNKDMFLIRSDAPIRYKFLENMSLVEDDIFQAHQLLTTQDSKQNEIEIIQSLQRIADSLEAKKIAQS